ncbi:DciA family protein [Reyranella sp.]|uniref:DciA family protein n=1 Tax=Reyranella sp. TaxID=1929291 RepID=UPI003BA85E71
MRENGFRAVGGLAQRLASDIARRRKAGRSGSVARLRAEWSAIVGAELARVSRPEALLPARGRGGAMLRLRVPGAAALEVQHGAGQIVERVNAYFGHRMIEDIRLVQGAVSAAPVRAATPPPDARSLQAAVERAAAVSDPDLRAALARLGARIGTGRRGLLLGLGGLLLAPRGEAEAQNLPREKLLMPLPGDHTMGRTDAPNILIDYASFTCPFCAQFYIAVMPTVRKEWIDTGKLLFVHRHFPSDVVATRASQLSECAGPEGFFPTVELLFQKQVEWLTGGDPLEEMVKVLAGRGMTPDKAEACFADDRAMDKVIADVQSGQALGVHSTPTLFINDQNYSNPGGADAIAAILRQVGR